MNNMDKEKSENETHIYKFVTTIKFLQMCMERFNFHGGIRNLGRDRELERKRVRESESLLLETHS